MTGVLQEHIEVVQGATGPKARIAGHRIRVQDVVLWHEKQGLSPDERSCSSIRPITLADVYAALAYYWDHRVEIEQAIHQERASVQSYQKDYIGSLAARQQRHAA